MTKTWWHTFLTHSAYEQVFHQCPKIVLLSVSQRVYANQNRKCLPRANRIWISATELVLAQQRRVLYTKSINTYIQQLHGMCILTHQVAGCSWFHLTRCMLVHETTSAADSRYIPAADVSAAAVPSHCPSLACSRSFCTAHLTSLETNTVKDLFQQVPSGNIVSPWLGRSWM